LKDWIESGFADVAHALHLGIADADTAEIHHAAGLAVGVGENLHFTEGVDPFVQPGLFEFIGGDEVVPVIVAELMHDHHLQCADALRHAIGAPGGDQGRVLHASRSGSAAAGIDDSEIGIGVIAVLVLEPGDGDLGRLEVTRSHGGVVFLDEGADLHILTPAVEDDEIGAGGPGEIMDILGVEAVGDGGVGIIRGCMAEAGGADDIVPGHGDVHIVDPEIGIEFRIGVKLVAVPGAVFVDADLGEPLAGHDELFLDAGAGHRRFGQFGGEGETEGDGLAGGKAPGEEQAEHGFILGVAVVRLDKVSPGEPLLTGGAGEGVDFDITPAFLAEGFAAMAAAGFAHESRLVVTEAVEIEVELEFLDGVVGGVAPAQYLVAVKKAGCGVKADVDIIVGDARTFGLREENGLAGAGL